LPLETAEAVANATLAPNPTPIVLLKPNLLTIFEDLIMFAAACLIPVDCTVAVREVKPVAGAEGGALKNFPIILSS